MHDKSPPYSHAAEMSVLGAVLIDRNAIALVLNKVGAADFYDLTHRTLFTAMVALFDEGTPIELVTLDNKVPGHLDAIAGLVDAVPGSASIEYHAGIVHDKAVLRRLLRAAQETVADVLESDGVAVAEVLGKAEARIMQVAGFRKAESAAWACDLVGAELERIDKITADGGGIVGLRTGFTDLDNMTSGLQKKDLIIVAGRPSMGKTALAQNVANNVAIRDGKMVALFSYEMSREQLMFRSLCSEAMVDAQRARRGRLTPEERVRLGRAADLIRKAPIWIDDSPGTTVTEMRASARRIMAEHPIDLVIVDYMQLMSGSANRGSREQEVSEISRGLKAMAKELDVPVMALSQLSRAPEARADKRPQLSDLRESGAIEQDADVVAFLYRPEYYFGSVDTQGNDISGDAELIISKQRNGPTGVVPLHFAKSCTRFHSIVK